MNRVRRQSVLVLVWAATLTFLAAQDLQRPPALILHNGRVLTMNNSFQLAEAVAVRNGRIQAVGSSADILKLAGPQTKKMDLRGKALARGFTDSHFHLVSAAMLESDPTTVPAAAIKDIKV